MAKRLMPNREELNRLFVYDQPTGNLVWRHRPSSDFQRDKDAKGWNARFAGTIAGSLDNSGHIRIRLSDTFFLAHRFIWAMLNDELPSVIDHVNGNPADNRIENLRASSAFENMRNIRRKESPTWKVLGIRKSRRSWSAQIGGGGANISLGSFRHRHEAIAVRKCAEIALGYDKNHGKARQP